MLKITEKNNKYMIVNTSKNKQLIKLKYQTITMRFFQALLCLNNAVIHQHKIGCYFLFETKTQAEQALNNIYNFNGSVSTQYLYAKYCGYEKNIRSIYVVMIFEKISDDEYLYVLCPSNLVSKYDFVSWNESYKIFSDFSIDNNSLRVEEESIAQQLVAQFNSWLLYQFMSKKAV